jgi:hypothetical protein
LLNKKHLEKRNKNKMKIKIALVSLAWLCIAGAHADVISVQDISMNAGETKTVEIIITKPNYEYVGFQMDLILPDGISINKAECSMVSRFYGSSSGAVSMFIDYGTEETLTIGKQGDNVYRMISTSLSLTPFDPTMVLKIALTAAVDTKGGKVKVCDIIFVTQDAGSRFVDDVSFNISVEGGLSSLGDVNGDGSVGAADVSAMINYILKRPNTAFVSKNADMNGDGSISATDVSTLINLILHKN